MHPSPARGARRVPPTPPAAQPASSAQGAPPWQREGSGSLWLESSRVFLMDSNSPFHEMDSGRNSQNFLQRNQAKEKRRKTTTEHHRRSHSGCHTTVRVLNRLRPHSTKFPRTPLSSHTPPHRGLFLLLLQGLNSSENHPAGARRKAIISVG